MSQVKDVVAERKVGDGEETKSSDAAIETARTTERPHYREGEHWCSLSLTSEPQRWEELKAKLGKVPVGATAAEATTWEDFAKEVEQREAGKPCVLPPCEVCDPRWSFEDLRQRFGDRGWRVSDTHGAILTLNEYQRYLETTTDDSPIGLYDSMFVAEGGPEASLAQEYGIPKPFAATRDLFALVDGEEGEVGGGDSTTRPPWRWLLFGGERGGTGIHLDPLQTHAWVHLTSGLKRWALFPPGTDTELIGLSCKVWDDGTVEDSVRWYLERYPKLKEMARRGEIEMVEVLQRPGETVFTPQGWPHLVLNLETSVAVTHNYATEFGAGVDGDDVGGDDQAMGEKEAAANAGVLNLNNKASKGQPAGFLVLWAELCMSEPEFAVEFLKALREKRPGLAEMCDERLLEE